MNFFRLGSTPEIELTLDGEDKRKTAEIKTEDGKKERHLLYYDGETVSGQVKITRRGGSKFEHQGIQVDLIGQIELYYDRGNQFTFLSLHKELARPGELLNHQQFNFAFHKVAKPCESYTGTNCKLRYFLRVSIIKRLTDIVKERELVVHTLSQYPDTNSSIKMEVGIEDCLHIEFEYNRSKYHLKDVIVGKIYFLLVRIKIKHMELSIIKRETTGSGPNTFNENETIAKFEIMDGAPVRGESIPIRVFLAGYDQLTPTFKDVSKKFSVRYYLNLVLVDEEDRRYFKQQEIVLWRKADKTRKTFQATLQQQYREMQNPNAQVYPSTSTQIAGKSSDSGSNGSVTDAAAIAAAPVPGTSAQARASERKKKQSKSEEDNQRIMRGIANMTVNNGGGKSSVHDDTIELSREEDSPRRDDANGGNCEQFSHEEENDVPQQKEAHFSNVVMAAGLSKRLSGDDSDDDDAPTLTGSICQADVHRVSHHEVAVDAATGVMGEKYENEKFTGHEGKCVNDMGKEE